jgi:hypothetical protein
MKTSAHNPTRYGINGGKYFTTVKPSKVECDISNLTKQIEKAFDHFNVKLFDGKLNRPAITIQRDAGTYGWCSIYEVWGNGSGRDGMRELNLTANYLRRHALDRWGTLIHEMVHLSNLQNGVLDCNPSNQYHNKKFKTLAESVGLVVTKEGHRGWCRTRVATSHLDGINPVAEEAISSLNLNPQVTESDFTFQRGEYIPTSDGGTIGPIGPRGGIAPRTGKGSGSKLKKWYCGCTNVRCAVDLVATCNGCGNLFERA